MTAETYSKLINSTRYQLESDIYPAERLPAACRTETCIVGIDEAGRGPVLGKIT